MTTARKSYPSDVSDAEWEFLLPYLTLMREDAPQRGYSLRDVFDAVRYVVKTGCQWDFLPHDLPPWTAVYQQARRWVAAGVFEAIAHDRRMILRMVVERTFGWLGRFRRLARDYERLSETLAGWHWLAFLTLLLPRLGLNSA